MQRTSKILVTGSTGLIGSALVRHLTAEGFTHLLTPSHTTLDLTDQHSVEIYFAMYQPEYVFHLAALVGGIKANNALPAHFIYNNTQMHTNVIHFAHKYGVKKCMIPGSSCTYPKFAPQPISETAFLTGAIEPTNLAYAAAKINAIVMAQSYAKQYGFNVIIPMPTNAYGIGDNFDPDGGHVIPALIRRFHEAKLANRDEVIIWGSGTPLREFINADDLASALFFLMVHYNSTDIINIGTRQEISIAELAQKIATVIGYRGRITMDTSKPDGAPRKCLNSERLFTLGWKPRVSLESGLQQMYQAWLLTLKEAMTT